MLLYQILKTNSNDMEWLNTNYNYQVTNKTILNLINHQTSKIVNNKSVIYTCSNKWLPSCIVILISTYLANKRLSLKYIPNYLPEIHLDNDKLSEIYQIEIK